jgi:hypothetical protein
MNSFIYSYWSLFIKGLATFTMVNVFNFIKNLMKHIVNLDAFWPHVYILGMFLTYVLEILDLLSLHVKLYHCNFNFGLSTIVIILQQKVFLCAKWFRVKARYIKPKV